MRRSHDSLGLIETFGIVPAVVAADAACKAAVVSLLGYEMAGGGLVTIRMAGDVAAVKAAVSAGAAAAGKVGKVISTHVIPRPDRQLRIHPTDPEGPVATKETAPPSPPAPREPEGGSPKARKPARQKKSKHKERGKGES